MLTIIGPSTGAPLADDPRRNIESGPSATVVPSRRGPMSGNVGNGWPSTQANAMLIGSTPWLRELGAWRERRLQSRGADALDAGFEFTSVALTLGVLVASSMMLSAGTYNPFIYFRF